LDTIPLELPFLSNFGLMLTYKCTTACPHCVVEAGPHRKEEVLLDQVASWIKQARNYRGGHIVGLALTGGEPFCIVDKLSQVVELAYQHGFLISVVTNAFWADTENAALSVLAKLPAIQMISISTDVYHLKTIPFKNVINLIRACRNLGRVYNIAVCTDNEENPQYLNIIKDLNNIGESDKIRPAITYPVGRAQNLVPKFRYNFSDQPPISACTMAGSPIAFPDGKMLACIGPLVSLSPGHPLYLGNLNQETLAEIMDRAEINPILHVIRIWGPHKLVSMLKEMGLDDALPREYISTCICDICYKLMADKILREALNEKMYDEQLKEFVAYARLYYLKETMMAQMLHLDDESIKLRKVHKL
jgi:organic radical activating enzyme